MFSLAPTTYIRPLGVPCSQYIDNRHVSQLALRRDVQESCGWSNFALAEAAAFIVCSVLMSLGYFIGLSKSVAVPQTRVRFLGLTYPTQSFKPLLSQKTRKSNLLPFVTLFSKTGTVSIKTLQCFAGKITFFSLAVPAAQLYARERYWAISRAAHSSRPIRVTGDLRSEIAYWSFLDSWSNHLPWMDEHHLTVKVTSYASTFT